MRAIILKYIFFIAFMFYTMASILGTTNGPKIIDVIGVDRQHGLVYLTYTWWAECDCETDLYTIHLSNGSVEIQKNWASRTEYSLKRDEVLKLKGLDCLEPLDTLQQALPEYSFSWLPKVDYYSPVIMKDTYNFPFQITIGEANFSYTQCFSRETNPEITFIEITPEVGLVHVRYKGECMEGNTVDQAIFYRIVEGKLLCKEIIK